MPPSPPPKKLRLTKSPFQQFDFITLSSFYIACFRKKNYIINNHSFISHVFIHQCIVHLAQSIRHHDGRIHLIVYYTQSHQSSLIALPQCSISIGMTPVRPRNSQANTINFIKYFIYLCVCVCCSGEVLYSKQLACRHVDASCWCWWWWWCWCSVCGVCKNSILYYDEYVWKIAEIVDEQQLSTNFIVLYYCCAAAGVNCAHICV